MLVLTRKENESIVIDSNIKVTILEISGNRIRLGIEAPQDVAVLRSELLESAKPIAIGRFVAPKATESLATAH